MRSDERDTLLYDEYCGEFLPTDEELYEREMEVERQIDEEREQVLKEKYGRSWHSDRLEDGGALQAPQSLQQESNTDVTDNQ